MDEVERIKYFAESLMKAVGEGITIEEYIRARQDMQCVEGKCPSKCNRCIKISDVDK